MPHLSKGVLILCVQVHRHGFRAIINPPVSFFVWQVKVIFIDSMSHKDYTGKRNAKLKRWLNKHEKKKKKKKEAHLNAEGEVCRRSV